MTAIAEWAADGPQPVRAALGTRRDAPDPWAVPAEPQSAGPSRAWTQPAPGGSSGAVRSGVALGLSQQAVPLWPSLPPRRADLWTLPWTRIGQTPREVDM
jgi:hypothetical protein